MQGSNVNIRESNIATTNAVVFMTSSVVLEEAQSIITASATIWAASPTPSSPKCSEAVKILGRVPFIRSIIFCANPNTSIVV